MNSSNLEDHLKGSLVVPVSLTLTTINREKTAIGNAKQEGICLQPILCKDKCGVARYGADGERKRRITLSVYAACINFLLNYIQWHLSLFKSISFFFSIDIHFKSGRLDYEDK